MQLFIRLLQDLHTGFFAVLFFLTVFFFLAAVFVFLFFTGIFSSTGYARPTLYFFSAEGLGISALRGQTDGTGGAKKVQSRGPDKSGL